MTNASPIPCPADAPPVVVTTPEGQRLRGRLYAQRQTEKGWVVLVGLVLWQTVDDVPAPGEYRSWTPAEHVHRIEGASYDAVPVERLPSYIEAPAPPATRVKPAVAWRVTVERRRTDVSVPTRTVVHRADCWQAQDTQPGAEDIRSEAEAREAMAQPGARGCTQCGTDVSLV